ncbi:MAG: tripartite tricarboxylate transporter permease [Candidatus Rokubacteria bacterium]|nr:tripartite tricarboxylate transporter permease [Candidatus Rokubacteria bacterium]
MWESILLGFSVVLQPINLLLCFVGVLIGTLIGVLPGLGPGATIALLFPVTLGMAPTSAIILLAGIFYGAQYGGSTTSILVNIPGEAASVVTCLDGHRMALQGRAGPALGIAALGSFVAGTVSVVGLMVLAVPLSSFALRFGPPEYFGLLTLGMTLVVYLAQKSVQKALISALLGIFISQVGIDQISSAQRFTFGLGELFDGISMVPLVMGLFGLGEVLLSLERGISKISVITHVKNLLPNLQDWKDSTWPVIRGSVLGFFLGVLPGGGPTLSSFASYGLEKRLSKRPERFGNGAIEGVAGPEAANNSATGGSFVPLLTLGVPTNVVMALLFSALMVHGVQPGPLLIKQYPDVFWGLIISMYLGNAILLVLNLPLITIWIKLLKIPYGILFPLIIMFTLIGAYSERGLAFDVFVMIVFGVVGYLMRKCEYEPAPLVLGFVLGDILEESLRRSLIMSDGSVFIFFERPISAAFLIFAMLLLISNSIPLLKERLKTLEKVEII